MHDDGRRDGVQDRDLDFARRIPVDVATYSGLNGTGSVLSQDKMNR